jgi:Family of unknown function (DUF5989)
MNSPESSSPYPNSPDPASPAAQPKSPEGASFREAGEKKELTLGQEVVQMLRYNKKYWMIPLVVILLIFGVVLILGSTSIAPFIYTLF